MTQIEQLPVTANGKLDKKGLPDIELEAKAYVEPRDEMEETIATIFGNVLNIERVGATEHVAKDCRNCLFHFITWFNIGFCL